MASTAEDVQELLRLLEPLEFGGSRPPTVGSRH